MDAQPTARLLVRALQGFEKALQDHLHAQGFTDVSVAQTNVLRHLDPQGMSQGDLARDAGVSKQAISQAVRTLVARDLVTVEVDPNDKRARRVCYTERGRALIASAIPYILEQERRWAQALGASTYTTLREALVRLPEIL